MVGHQETMIGVQDITCLGSIDKWLTSRKPMAGASENQGLGSRKPMVGVQGTNCLGPGKQWPGHKKPMVGAQEINGWERGCKWFVHRELTVVFQHFRGTRRTHTDPWAPMDNCPMWPPRFTSSATRAIFLPATVRCIGLSRLYGYRVRGIASSPAVIMAQLQAFKADQIRAGCSAAPYTNSYFPCLLNRCAG